MSAPAVPGPPDWLDDLDLHVGPPDASMGTRALDPERWLLVDGEWTTQRDEARRLLRDRRADVLAPPQPGRVYDAAVELGERIATWLAVRWPGHPAGDGVGVDRVDDPDPLGRAAASVAEDLCLLAPADGSWMLAAGCVCFPSYWRLRDKIGRSLADVHAPVPGYAGSLAGRVDTFLDRLLPGRGVWRRNWSIHDNPTLFVPVQQGGDDAASPAPEPWLRSEYQTLLRLEDTGLVVFTIRTQQVPLGALADRPDLSARLVDAVRGWSPGVTAYKGDAVTPAVLALLDDPV